MAIDTDEMQSPKKWPEMPGPEDYTQRFRCAAESGRRSQRIIGPGRHDRGRYDKRTEVV